MYTQKDASPVILLSKLKLDYVDCVLNDDLTRSMLDFSCLVMFRFKSLFSLRDFVHSGYCDPQRRRLLLLLLALALAALASSQIVSPPKI